MDYYISTKIVSDYNNLRMLKRVEQVPVAIEVAIQEPQEQRLQQIKTDPVHNVAEEAKEKKGEEVKKAITEVKKKSALFQNEWVKQNLFTFEKFNFPVKK